MTRRAHSPSRCIHSGCGKPVSQREKHLVFCDEHLDELNARLDGTLAQLVPVPGKSVFGRNDGRVDI